MTEFDAMFEKGGFLEGGANRDFMLRTVRKGYSGKPTRTHTFKLIEEGGLMRIDQPKFLRPAQRD